MLDYKKTVAHFEQLIAKGGDLYKNIILIYYLHTHPLIKTVSKVKSYGLKET